MAGKFGDIIQKAREQDNQLSGLQNNQLSDFPENQTTSEPEVNLCVKVPK